MRILFKRIINVEVLEKDAETYRITAWQENIKDDVPKERFFSATLDVDMNSGVIQKVVGAELDGSFGKICQGMLKPMERLVGLRIEPGFANKMLKAISGSEGCTHMGEIVLEISRCYLQAKWLQLYLDLGPKVAANTVANMTSVACGGILTYVRGSKCASSDCLPICEQPS